MNFPNLPIDLASLPGWLQNAMFLLPLALLVLQIPWVKGLKVWWQAAVAFGAVQFVGIGALLVAPLLTPEFLEKAQPVYAQFLVGFYVIAGVFGVVFGVRYVQKDVKARTEHRQELWRVDVEARRALIRDNATPPERRPVRADGAA